jgi:hypothetical protein
MVPMAGMLRLSNGNRPVTISQMANKTIPRLPLSLTDPSRLVPPVGLSKIKTPAAIASIANMIPIPAMLILSSGSSPVKMSQMASKTMPILFVSLMGVLLCWLCLLLILHSFPNE